MGTQQHQMLADNWQLNVKDRWIPAVVPGSVYTDMLRAGLIENPFWKDNEDKICGLMSKDYEYRCEFTAQTELLECDTVLLRFEGLDTLADIFLNGTLIGSAQNMHRIWEYDVKHWLSAGKNELRVLFRSPLEFIARAHEKYKTLGNDDTFEGFMHLRKAHYMFGWDWGAHLPDAGIFRPVSLVGISTARIDNVYIVQEHQAEGAGEAHSPAQKECCECTQDALAQGNTVLLNINVEVNMADAPWKEVALDRSQVPMPDMVSAYTSANLLCYTVEVIAPDGSRKSFENSPAVVAVNQPQLWYPNGLGAQPLYTVIVTLINGNEVLDVWERKIGLRTLTVRRQKDAWGESFNHEINGHAVFAMGADYIPEDHLIGRTSREKTWQLLCRCKAANFNSIRVWGGGYYPDDWFYDACDALGLMVWQDFMFACSVYELTPEFEANITWEFVDNIKRIRHHASLALWCGNNEMEMFVDERCWVSKPTEVRDYLFMYERIIPAVLKRYDPATFYWPASPSSGGSFDAPNDENRGDVHYWEVWHGAKPFTEYRKHYFRYLSEFGFQSFPSIKTLETITDDPKDMNPFSYIMEKHERNYGANGKIMNYMQQFFLYPGSFPLFIYASQLLQAEAIRYGVEHFRRNRERCGGAVYWQLNDCWPVVSWSSIDYCGRLKALHYYARRFFAPILLSCQEEGMMSAQVNLNRQHPEYEKSVRFNVSNETLTERHVRVCFEVRNTRAQILRCEYAELAVPPLSAVWLDKVELPEIQVMDEYVSYHLLEDDKLVSEGSVIFSYPKYFHYEDPKLTWTLDGDVLTIYAGAYAKSVEILNASEDLVLSDNYFDMDGGQKSVKILSGTPEGIRVRSVYDIR